MSVPLSACVRQCGLFLSVCLRLAVCNFFCWSCRLILPRRRSVYVSTDDEGSLGLCICRRGSDFNYVESHLDHRQFVFVGPLHRGQRRYHAFVISITIVAISLSSSKLFWYVSRFRKKCFGLRCPTIVTLDLNRFFSPLRTIIAVACEIDTAVSPRDMTSRWGCNYPVSRRRKTRIVAHIVNFVELGLLNARHNCESVDWLHSLLDIRIRLYPQGSVQCLIVSNCQSIRLWFPEFKSCFIYKCIRHYSM